MMITRKMPIIVSDLPGTQGKSKSGSREARHVQRDHNILAHTQQLRVMSTRDHT